MLVCRYRLQPGPAPGGSCGVQVAATAGLPAGLVARAAGMAAALERRGLRTQQARRSPLRALPNSPAGGPSSGGGGADDEERRKALAVEVCCALEAAAAAGGGGGTVQWVRELQAAAKACCSCELMAST